MPRLLFQRTGHLRRYHRARAASHTLLHDTLVSQNAVSIVLPAAVRPARMLWTHPSAHTTRRAHVSDTRAPTRYFLHSI